jgi:hypothetical protein
MNMNNIRRSRYNTFFHKGSLIFTSLYNQALDEHFVWPERVEYVEFKKDFNQSIDKALWPDTIDEIVFGKNFNQPVENVKWPKSLKTIIFGDRFNQPIKNVRWPDGLETVIFGKDFNHSLKSDWPKGIQIKAKECLRDDYDDDNIDEEFDDIIKRDQRH